MPNDAQEGLLVSYLTLRRLVGLLGCTFPPVLVLLGFIYCGWWHFQPSISDYYALRTRDVFVGFLFAIGTFLFTYRGYELKDDVAGKFAAGSAVGVALFPNSGAQWYVHYASALLMFSLLAYYALRLFTKSSGVPTPQKLTRNRWYRLCGWTIVGCLVLIALYQFLLKNLLKDTWVPRAEPVLALESTALFAFGFAWWVKGETLWKDIEPAAVPLDGTGPHIGP